jgi:hypothetical protein
MAVWRCVGGLLDDAILVVSRPKSRSCDDFGRTSNNLVRSDQNSGWF